MLHENEQTEKREDTIRDDVFHDSVSTQTKKSKPSVSVLKKSEAEVVKEKKSTGGFLSFLFDWVELFAVSLAVVIILMTFFVRHSPVVGSSMEPTVHGSEISYSTGTAVQKNGDVMLISNLFYSPAVGDIVVINSPHNLSEPIIKRIIATGGQTVEIDFNNWTTTVDGVVLDEPYLSESSINEFYEELNPNVTDRQNGAMQSYGMDPDGDGYVSLVVPEGCVFVMGDHRNNSKDSRTLGCIDERYILGRVLLRITPFDRFGTVA